MTSISKSNSSRGELQWIAGGSKNGIHRRGLGKTQVPKEQETIWEIVSSSGMNNDLISFHQVCYPQRFQNLSWAEG